MVWGVQPRTVEMGVELSSQVAGSFEELLRGVLEELRTWGVEAVAQETAEA